MAITTERLDAIGIVRSFTTGTHSADGKATFFLEADKRIIPCHISTPAGTPPRNGQRVRVVGTWTVDTHGLLCVDVHAVLPGSPLPGSPAVSH